MDMRSAKLTPDDMRAETHPDIQRRLRERAKQVSKESEFMKGRSYMCHGCFKLQKDLEPGKKFLACSKCRPLGRVVFYCSRYVLAVEECSKTDSI